jgi:2-polyprenyl-6-methoxyphenol hydroxylase-like FAD-dependent oxidoreductase
VTTVENRATKREYRICSKQVVGCDGAKSRVRSSLGITCEGSTTDEMMMTIHFKADLRSVVGEHVGMLHWIMDPEVSGFIIGYDLEDNQVLICNFDVSQEFISLTWQQLTLFQPKKQPVSSWDEKLCRKTITAAIGRDIAFDFLSNRPWIFRRSVAERYNVGNVFLWVSFIFSICISR